MLTSKKILVLAPHTDDGELGCGASIAKYSEQGKEVIYIAFSTCSQSLPKELPKDTLANECKAATEVLNISGLHLFDYEVRKLNESRQEILEQLISLNKQIQPQTIFVPAQHDVHQDHHVIYEEGMRAFKNCNILGYELPWNNFQFSPNYFEKIEEPHLQNKISALKEYKSQSHRTYMTDNFVRSLAIVRGVQSNTTYAEAFEVYRLFS